MIARLAIECVSAASTSSDGGASAAQPESHPPGGKAEEHAQATAVGAEASISDEDTSHLEANAVATPSTPSAPRAAEDVEVIEGTEGAKTPAASSDPDTVYAGPAVRKLAREFGVTLSQVKGTGARGGSSRKTCSSMWRRPWPLSPRQVGQPYRRFPSRTSALWCDRENHS